MMIAHVMSAHWRGWLQSVQGFDASNRSSGDYELLLPSLMCMPGTKRWTQFDIGAIAVDRAGRDRSAGSTRYDLAAP